jgi:hypothetical protein
MVVKRDSDKRRRRHHHRRITSREISRDEMPSVRMITAATPYGYVEEHLTPFGGIFPLEKLYDALEVESAFAEHFIAPKRTPEIGHWRVVKGIVNSQFMGRQRLYHLKYVQDDPMFKGVLQLDKLPAVSTFWRCLNSYGINQDRSLLKFQAAVRERAWHSLAYEQHLAHIHVDIDTTVKTVYGHKDGARKGHNRKHRGKRALRPVLAFIAETKEYLAGKLRAGKTISGAQVEKFIASLRPLLPSAVGKVTLRADSEFYCWQAVKTARAKGFDYIISVKKSCPQFDENKWYSVGKDDAIQYNEALYQPTGWDTPCRYVAARIRKNPKLVKNRQGELLEDGNYKHRIFVTSREAAPHHVIEEYDGRAGAEKLIAEAHNDGLAAIPSKHFDRNRAFLQIAMFSYNLWRHLKAFANQKDEVAWSLQSNETSRLRLLFLAAKVNFHRDRTEIKFSAHLAVRPTLDNLFQRLDHLREHREVWKKPLAPATKNSLRPREQDRIVQKILCMTDG